MSNNELNLNKTESYENGKDETDKINKEQENSLSQDEDPSEKEKPSTASSPSVFVPKYKYSDGLYLVLLLVASQA